jgi:hypothetical protein
MAAQARAVRERELHLGQIRGHRFLAGRGPKVTARCLADDGETTQALTHRVRDPEAFTGALGHRL